MRIALIVPDFLSGTSFLQQPLDFLYCATLLEKSGHQVDVIDCRTSHYSHSMIFNLLANSELIILTTTPCDQVQNYYVDYRYGYAVQLANSIKINLPDIPLAICGAHSTVRPDLIKKEFNADIIVMGEIIALVPVLADCLTEHISLDQVPNIHYKVDERWLETMIDLSLWHPVLDDDVFPAFNKIPMEAYFGVEYQNNIPLRKQGRAVLQSGRGCPYACNFCHNFYGRKVRRRNYQVVATEAEICWRDYHVKEIFFLDELFTMDRNWVICFCREICRRGIQLSFTVQTRIDCLDDELLEEMYLAGVRDIWLGVESGDDDILRISNKGETNAALMPVIDMIRRHRIRPNAFFMIGMPGETIQSLNKTLRVIYDEKIPYTRSIMICTPRYNTPYYEMAVKEYPYINNHWYNLNAVKGLVANEMTPAILQKVKDILKDRDFLYKSQCPQL